MTSNEASNAPERPSIVPNKDAEGLQTSGVLETGTGQRPSTFEEWRRSLSYFTGLGLTPDEREERSKQKEHERCETMKDALLQSSPSLPDHIEAG